MQFDLHYLLCLVNAHIFFCLFVLIFWHEADFGEQRFEIFYTLTLISPFVFVGWGTISSQILFQWNKISYLVS